ncbi:MAG: hypothetical protein NVS3B20_13480 [Polyangiales bacterium]
MIDRMTMAALCLFSCIALGCETSAVGDPCTPEKELDPAFNQFDPSEYGTELNSPQCETRVCLRHYFKGRVTCPYGNGAKVPSDPSARCVPVAGKMGLFVYAKADGTPLSSTAFCCPIPGDIEQRAIQKPVDPQCRDRPAKDAVYCSCRCDVPDDPDIDRSQINLCACPTGFSCTPLCGIYGKKPDGSPNVIGNCTTIQPKGLWGSYCVKDKEKDFPGKENSQGAFVDQQAARCGFPLTPPM